mmetsp:Transcript_4715/g.11739  ORF Transcript_4715/g.11739 Transcript_4715/m.11739 type:complete len:437 (-) Transcript_4715:103-1413(-)
MFDWWRFSRKLSHRSVESIMRLPVMSDPKNVAAMQVLNITFVVLAFTRDELSPWVVIEMCRITLEHGLSPVASIAFALFGYSMGGLGRNPEEALRFGQLALALYRKFGARSYMARVCALYYDGVHCWKRSPSEMFTTLTQASQVGMETGDTEFGLLCAGLPAWTKLSFTPLHEIDRELTLLEARMKVHRQSTFDNVIRPLHQFAQSLMGLGVAEDIAYLRGEIYTDDLESSLPKEHPARCWAKVYQVVMCCLFGRYNEAVQYSKLAIEVIKRDFGPISVSETMFFCGFADVAYARERRKKKAHVARRYCHRLFQWSQRAPDNFSGMYLLLDAELTALANQQATYLKYKNALAVLNQGNYFPLVALGSERLALYLRDYKGDHGTARLFFQQALENYSKWGAVAKVQHLSKELQLSESGFSHSTITVITPAANDGNEN